MPNFDLALIDTIRSHAESEDLLPGAQLATIALVERSIAHELPPSFKEFLTLVNGGVVGGSIRLFGVGRDDYLDFVAKLNEYSEFIPPVKARVMIPFASDWGGGLYCFDTYHPSSNGEYPIWYWNHEYSEEPADAPFVWCSMDTDFATFMQKQVTTDDGG